MKTIGLVGGMSWASSIEYYRIINELINRGSDGIILGCTELPLLIKQQDSHVPLFNTTEIHAKAAANLALENNKVTL